MKKLIMTVIVFQFILSIAAYSSLLLFNDQGDVLAETDRYLVRFEKGGIAYFHNKLTDETYTHENLPGKEGLFESEGGPWNRGTTFFGIPDGVVWVPHHTPIQIEKISPLQIKMTYLYNEATLHLFIGIDPQNTDLLIRLQGINQKPGATEVVWGLKNLSHALVDVIIPANGGQILTENAVFRKKSFDYPETLEASLVIFQGKMGGGFFVRNDDTQYHFKSFLYQRHADNFRFDFSTQAFKPFEDKKNITTATWRLNAYQGNWQVPALAYREWMHQAFQPPDRQVWVNDIECVITLDVREPGEKLRLLNQLVDPSKTMLYLADWRAAGYDIFLPDYTPRPEFGHFITEAKRYGFKVMIHTTMNGVSENHPLYASLEKYQVVTDTGEKDGYLWEEKPVNPRRFAYINPASRLFRRILVSSLKDLCETYPIDAIHLDVSSRTPNITNGIIDGLTMAEGNILLHQELKASIPGIVLGGEELTEVTFLHESFAQRSALNQNEHPHPISSFLYEPYVRFYGHLGYPNPDKEPEKFKVFQEEYAIWNVLPTIPIFGVSDLEANRDDRIETQKFFERVRQRQGYVFGDINSDGVVNVLDLVLVANAFGGVAPDINKDGVVNVLDLVLVSNAMK